MKVVRRIIPLIVLLQASPHFAEGYKATGLVVDFKYFQKINKKPVRTFLFPAIKSIPNSISKKKGGDVSPIADYLQGPISPKIKFENKSLLDCTECMDAGLSTSEFTWQLIKSGTFYGGIQKTLP
jgi:hypothetical protein